METIYDHMMSIVEKSKRKGLLSCLVKIDKYTDVVINSVTATLKWHGYKAREVYDHDSRVLYISWSHLQ